MLILHKRNNYLSKGFTLIELLVVIAIIGILAGMVLVSMNGARSKARDARRLSDMRQLISAQEMNYGNGAGDTYLQYAGYPPAIGAYLASTPKDPTDVSPYQYAALNNLTAAAPWPNPQFFCYYAKLENAVNGKTFYTASQAGNFYRTTAPSTFGMGACTNAGCGTTQAAAAATDCSTTN